MVCGPAGRQAAGPPGRRAAGPPGRRAAGPPGRRAAADLTAESFLVVLRSAAPPTGGGCAAVRTGASRTTTESAWTARCFPRVLGRPVLLGLVLGVLVLVALVTRG
ncbi:hypothetical protein ABZY42_28550, partial [Streptomyces sp. NPDC006622]|uniref:hypothetical protein n=1 Tax=Streptomyces sp. NPDC006622 TaxID=3155459 RepID=UPI0033B75A28